MLGEYYGLSGSTVCVQQKRRQAVCCLWFKIGSAATELKTDFPLSSPQITFAE